METHSERFTRDKKTKNDPEEGLLFAYRECAPYPYLERRGLLLRRSSEADGIELTVYEEIKIGPRAKDVQNSLPTPSRTFDQLSNLFNAAERAANDNMYWIGRDGVWMDVYLYEPSQVHLEVWSPKFDEMPGRFCAFMDQLIKRAFAQSSGFFTLDQDQETIEVLVKGFKDLGQHPGSS